MADLSVVAVLTAKPGSADIVRDALVALVAPTRAEEGCLSYELFASDQPDTFVTNERWRAPEDLGAHMQTDHVQAAFAAAGDHLAVPPAIHSLTPIPA